MNTNIKIFLLCPVPEEQKPIQEYIGLKENFLTGWTTFSTKNYQKKIFSLFFNSFFLISLFQLSNFQGIYYLFEWIIENLQWTTFFLTLFFFILLSRWIQVENRFYQARVVYEEASWYDGQIWEKPLSIIKNDQLIRYQKIQPIRKRIQKTCLQLLFVNFIWFVMLELLLM